MGMSTHVVGFRAVNDEWRRMKAVWDACRAARVPVPSEVSLFFGGSEPDPAGAEVDQAGLVRCGAVRKWTEEGRSGFEVLVDKLPPGVTVVRVYNAW